MTINKETNQYLCQELDSTGNIKYKDKDKDKDSISKYSADTITRMLKEGWILIKLHGKRTNSNERCNDCHPVNS